ncbi:MAG TPA: transketolase C-terminal domain-containing protein [Anaerohalosphaeraceae bacterium]|nr:transketolase C-terminal domain-containing protein [Anaerohalosphaeraceae bacterium]HOL88400.1 transketolase C-terminal domain-containing protein [Anaerohalosphaeraceae bacterium]HPP55052.1 transketolase C-terminal domain-containing protein [Anaerohalosphaeraceae bacterium]
MSGAAAMETAKANLDVFSETLLALARKNRNILVVTSDSRGSGKLVPFAQALPGQIVEVGIAEQNLVGIAAGLASAGKIVFAVSPGSFLTARSLEQIKNDVCYSDHPVKLVGISSGVSYGALGSTHHSLHDLAVLRAIPNCTIVVPADNFETAEAVKAAAEMPHPVFLRFGKRPMPPLHRPGTKFTVGKSLLVRRGNDIAFIATGETVVQAAGACDLLAREGISARVLSMHTVKPLDEEAVLQAAQECGAVVTVEEHSCAGGLGEACAAVLLQSGVSVPFRIVGFPDEETVSGSQLDMMAYYGISPEGLAETARTLLNRKRL